MFIKRPRLRRAVTRAWEGDSDQQIEIFGTKLTVNTIKENGYLRAWRKCQSSSLLKEEVSVLLDLVFLLDRNDTFVDVGANVGIYALSIARLAKLIPGLRIYAFEANPDTHSRLAKSAPPFVHTEAIALADRTGSLEFREGAVSHVFTSTDSVSEYVIQGQTQTIPTRRLDECDIQGDSLVIKIDVEGQEANVLKGASGLLDAKRVKVVYLDGYHDRGVEDMLRNCGFHLFDGRTLEPLTQTAFSLLAIHPDKQPGLRDVNATAGNKTNP